MSHDPGGLPFGFEFEWNTYWCGPGEMHSVHPTPRLVISLIGFRLLSSTWYRLLVRSATHTLPRSSTCRPCGRLNSPSPFPAFSLPACATNRPFLSYFTTRLL